MSTYPLVAQGICLVILVALFFYVFKKYPLKKDIRSLVYASLFVLLSVVLNALSLAIPFFGVPSVKVGFTFLPLFMCGLVLSPSWAYLVGLVMDIIGLMITPTGFPFLGFTLNHVLAACLPALWYVRSKEIDAKKIQLAIKVIFIFISIAAIGYINFLDEVNISGSIYVVNGETKLLLTLYIVVMCIVMVAILSYTRKKMNHELASDLAKWMAIIVLGEILINFICTPIWLDVMYSIPWFISTFIRIVKACVMIPVQIFVGYSCIKILKRIIH